MRLSPLELCLRHRFLLERFQKTYPACAVRRRNLIKSTGGLFTF
ncbi:hypothetical protein FM101_12990 [Arthrobacter rhombi]|uniref:Uncharacterized protein n=1 Tax=Arthrobacter rhombi TaxID=71253 RepID=A0A1R4GSF2_9MICC|nr:hypothetical protein FM101_12990 [Arthrobacter rhombi]